MITTCWPVSKNADVTLWYTVQVPLGENPELAASLTGKQLLVERSAEEQRAVCVARDAIVVDDEDVSAE